MTPTFSRFAFLLILLLLSGCHTAPRHTTSAGKVSVAAPPVADTEAARLQQCRKDIEVLTKINNPAHTTLKQEFDRVMGGAAQYSGIRAEVTDNTQNTIDALYRYRVSILCTKISTEVLNGLTERGETQK
jgi:hypothetical protein